MQCPEAKFKSLCFSCIYIHRYCNRYKLGIKKTYRGNAAGVDVVGSTANRWWLEGRAEWLL